MRSILGIKINQNSEFEDKKKRWAIVCGEINAYNNSDILKKEGKDLLKFFFENKFINKDEYDENMKVLN